VELSARDLCRPGRGCAGGGKHPEVVRYFMLASHYRGPINYSSDSLEQAKAALDRLYLALRGVQPAAAAPATAATAHFVAAMDDDFNTPEAIAELQSLARSVNSAKAAGRGDDASLAAAELRALGARLGLLGQDPEIYLRKVARRAVGAGHAEGAATVAGVGAAADAGGLSDADIEDLIAQRAAARKGRDFKESDRIRDLLAAAGVLLEDQPGGKTLWRRG
jgi:cysteinyl-tRNA synthetase